MEDKLRSSTALFALGASLSPASARILESLHRAPKGWTKAAPALPSDRLTLHIALAHADTAALEAAAHAVANPDSPEYGNHLSHDELSAAVAPSEEARSAVAGWLAQHHIFLDNDTASQNNEWLTIHTNASTANALLGTEFAWYRHKVSGSGSSGSSSGDILRLRTLSYSVPDSVVPYVDLVQPTTRFGRLEGDRKKPVLVAETTVVGENGTEVTELIVGGRIRHYAHHKSHHQHQKVNSNCTRVSSTKSSTVTLSQYSAYSASPAAFSSSAAPEPSATSTSTESAAVGACNTTVTPACLKTMYNIHYTPPNASNAGTIGFTSFLGQAARYADLAVFEKARVPEAVGQNFSVVTFGGGENDQSILHGSVEANLDAQYVVGISNPIPVVEYITGGQGPLIPSLDNTYPSTNEPYLTFLNSILALPAASLPHTLTTSYGEEEQSVPRAFALKVCNLFMQLGLRGVSVVFSSGDEGPGDACTSNVDNTTTTFEPSFPAGCPWVTTVGSTTGSTPETGAVFSGGGFSIFHARPAWQDEVVGTYLDSIGDTYAGFYNASGRGIPDVATQGQEFLIVNDGVGAVITGTSASAPTFAGMIALLNAARQAQGKPGLGFLNPFLYSKTTRNGLSDITTGFSAGCVGGGGSGGLPVMGARWNCTKGWDPVTGLGTPQFDVLLELAAPGTKNE